MHLERLGPRCEDPTYKVLVNEFPQGSSLQAHADNASSLKVSRVNQRKLVQQADRKLILRASKDYAYLLSRNLTVTLGLASYTRMTWRNGRVPVAQVKGMRRSGRGP